MKINTKWIIVGVVVLTLVAAAFAENGKIVLFLFGGVILYFLPTFIAVQNQNRNTTALAVLNTFLGWTLIGWVGALIWALYREKQ